MSAQHQGTAVLLVNVEVTCECMEYNKICYSGSFASSSSIGYYSSPSEFRPFLHQHSNQHFLTCALQVVVYMA